MLEDLLDGDSVVGPQPEASANQILALVGQTSSELDVGVADLLVLLEGNVSADHVVEQDAEAPDGGGDSVVTAEADPLRRSVNASSCKRKQNQIEGGIVTGDVCLLFFFCLLFFSCQIIFKALSCDDNILTGC